MRTRFTNARGLSLIEVTIMLLVLMLLTGVLAPSMFDFIKKAQWVKVKEDCEAIAISVVRLTSDVGACLKFDANERCTMENRVDILYSDGPEVKGWMLGPDAAGYANAGLDSGVLNWNDDDWRGDSMEDQFVYNPASGPHYPTPADLGTYSNMGLTWGMGWRGAYLSPPIGPDPWGHRYLVNTVFLAMASDAGSGGGLKSVSVQTVVPPPAGGGWSNDTFCISAGPNGQYETAFGGNATHGVYRRGDDFIYIISGDTR